EFLQVLEAQIGQRLGLILVLLQQPIDPARYCRELGAEGLHDHGFLRERQIALDGAGLAEVWRPFGLIRIWLGAVAGPSAEEILEWHNFTFRFSIGRIRDAGRIQIACASSPKLAGDE